MHPIIRMQKHFGSLILKAGMGSYYSLFLIICLMIADYSLYKYREHHKKCTKLEFSILVLIVCVIIGGINYYFLIELRHTLLGYLVSFLPFLSLLSYLIGFDKNRCR